MSESQTQVATISENGIVIFDAAMPGVKPTKFECIVPRSAWHGDPIRVEIERYLDFWEWRIPTPDLYGTATGTPAKTAREAMEIARRALRFWAEAIDEELARIDGKEEEAGT